MATIRIKRAKVKNQINRLKRAGKSFELQATGYSKIIKVQGGKTYVISQDKHNNDLFHAKRKIEEDINLCHLEFDRVSRDDIKYFDLGNRLVEAEKRGTISNVLNLDITAAYPTVLYNLGFISKATYEHLIKADKAVRLRSIGMIATRKTIFYYENGKFIKREIKQNQRNRDIFYLICSFVGEVISQFAMAYPENFLYFWTDGIYIDMEGLDRAEVIKYADEIFKHYQLQYHALDIKGLKVSRSDDKSLIFVEFLKDGKRKPFIIPARKLDQVNNKFINHENTKTNTLKLWTTLHTTTLHTNDQPPQTMLSA